MKSISGMIDVYKRQMFLDESTCVLTFKDIGFGEFYPSTGFVAEKVLHLGGINGQFNSMS